MSKRVSHSLLDPFFLPLVQPLYRVLPIPRWYPPEGIILIGHLFAIAGAVGFALSTAYWWGGLLAAAGVIGNHVADMVDGTHARATDQCRNGGELLDHFTDPVSFSYWMIGFGVACDRPWLALVCVLWILATAVLTNIKAKITGEFTLARIGPTEFKTVLAVLGMATSALHAWTSDDSILPPVTSVVLVLLWLLAVLGVVQLIVNLVRAVMNVNRSGVEPDVSEWVMTSADEREHSDE